MAITASAERALCQHSLHPRPERTKSVSRSHAPQSGPLYPSSVLHFTRLEESYGMHDTSLKHVYIGTSSVTVVTVGLYHVFSLSVSFPSTQRTPNFGQVMHSLVVVIKEAYVPSAHARHRERDDASLISLAGHGVHDDDPICVDTLPGGQG